ncbi:MAG: tetratricopeptide repeat protein, partial [Acidobacteria bacterium]|nr:tetratricopeptide repeat protein [Acidobacteriota bacterium]
VASLYGENGQVDDAVKLLRSQLSSTEADRETYLNIAQVYERARRYKEAEEAAKAAEALHGDPRDNETTYFLLGAIYERQKLYDKAEEQFKKVISMDPGNAPALNYYGFMLGDLGQRLDEAEAMVNSALKIEPYNGAYLDSLGWIYYKQGKYNQAESWLHKAVERDPHDPNIRSHLGDVYAKQGRTEQAATEWERALTEWRRSLPADMETDKIAEVEKKVGSVKHRVAQKSTPQDTKHQ